MSEQKKPAEAMQALLALMARLRDPETGCPWDRAQDFASIAPYTIEEAYEVADAIERNRLDELRDELGDLLFQVVFHSRMAEEQGLFDFAAVAEGIVEKMIRRHPHVFGDKAYDDLAAQQADWEAIKAAEKGVDDQPKSRMDGVAAGLPEWMRALKLQKRAARVGFDWPDAQGPLENVREELAELEEAMSKPDAPPARVEEELGDVLFSVINLARKLEVDPGRALRGCNRRFEQRFRRMEQQAATPLEQLDAEALETLWQQAKRVSGSDQTP